MLPVLLIMWIWSNYHSPIVGYIIFFGLFLDIALKQLKDSQRPSYVLFLTDGLPTAGETNERKIVANAQEANEVRARIFSFGVGYDVNSRLLDKLVRENFGQSEYVRPDEDIEDRVSRIYRRIESPVMTDVKIAFAFDELRTDAGTVVGSLSASAETSAKERFATPARTTADNRTAPRAARPGATRARVMPAVRALARSLGGALASSSRR